MTARPNGFRREVIAISAIAMCWRTFWLRWAQWDIGDSREYVELAGSILRSGVYGSDSQHPSSYRPPLYPVVIAAADWLTGHPIATVLIVQVIIGTLTVTLTCLIAAKWFDRRTALIAGVMMAVAPMTSRYASVLLTETLFTFLVISSLAAWSGHQRFVAGVLLGLATLTRASTMPFVLVIGLVGLVRVNRLAHRQLLVVFAGALLVLAPWVARNYAEFGRVTVADAGFGVNLLHGTAELQRGSNRWTQLNALSESAGAEGDERGSAEGEARARHLALTRIRSHPLLWLRARAGQWPWLFLDSGDYLPIDANRFSFGQALATGHVSTSVVKLGFIIGNAIVFALAMFGLWVSRHRFVELSPVWSFPVFLTVAHAPMYIEPRYGLPLIPFILIFAAAGVTHLSHILHRGIC